MEKWQIISLLAIGIILFIAAIYVRVQYGDKYQLKTIDLALIILPLIFVALTSGNIKVLEAFGLKADFSDLFSKAAEKTINTQVTDMITPEVDELVNMLEMASKGGVQDIPQLVKDETEALVFQLGHGGYYGPAIEQYFDALYASSYLQFFIINGKDGLFFGFYDVLDLAVYFRNEDDAYREFASLLNTPTTEALARLKTLPGFVGVDQAVMKTLTKQEVLKQLDGLRLDNLPVIDTDNRFVGTVERSQVTASVILDVVERLETKK